MPKCILCGRSPRKVELPELSNPRKFLSLYSLRRKILYRHDHSLKSYVVHAQSAVQIQGMGNGWHQIKCFPLGRVRPQHAIGVLNGKLYWDDFPHFDHDGTYDGIGLTPTEINLLLGITPAERQPIDAQTRQMVLDRFGHKCVRCNARNDLELHHRRPVIHGGTNDPDNLVPLCYGCHTQHAGEFIEPIWPDLKSIFLQSEQENTPRRAAS
jgi:hypothetical protein